MGPPSQLAIATSSLLRLVKEETSYHKELQQQESRIAKLEQDGGDENIEYTIKQEKRGVEETKAIFPQLKDRIKAAMEKLDMQIEAAQEDGSDSKAEEINKAKEAMVQAKTSYLKDA